MKKKVELLAPAGNYEAFLGAVNAGADAVYLGGEKFGARAYADNFTTEEICRAIHIAHFMGRKIYLTVNTLIKERELAELYSYLHPFYEAGLDGVIVQDIGALCYIREHFKGLKLHASTQMTLTGAGGVSLLKDQGVERIVPARELSLAEVRSMKEQTGMEIECFIHGAMCYCYSGQCLFSSILGGRSGNRGRCAQPCRLPYRICEGKKDIPDVEYPLSLKDMCTISYIPRLIEAGIDSFKIEGRMKKPEYAAGVTALYRKYINLYEQEGAEDYHVAEEDLQKLRSLYIRSEIQTGYYERHNGREMITLNKPGYAGSDRIFLDELNALYVREPDRHPVKMKIILNAGEKACLQVTDMHASTAAPDEKSLTLDRNGTEQSISVTVYGAFVEPAKKMPLQTENVRKQMLKTGNSCVDVKECEIVMEGEIFLPVSALNELRRMGVDAYENARITRHGLLSGRKIEENGSPVEKGRADAQKDDTAIRQLRRRETQAYATDILVSTYEQLAEAVTHPCRRIYIDSDLYLAQQEQILRCMRQCAGVEFYLALPYILRKRDEGYLQQLTAAVMSAWNSSGGHVTIGGFLVRSLEGAAYVKRLGADYEIVPDAGLYAFNTESIRFWSQMSREYTLPYELNRKEAVQLTGYADSIGMNTALIVYSRIPMMIAANCVRKTANQCLLGADGQARPEQEQMWLKDRYAAAFPVLVNCQHCYNIIYNSVPYSLHLQEQELNKIGADVRRYDFTLETAQECRLILSGERFPWDTYTTGHLKRGVE